MPDELIVVLCVLGYATVACLMTTLWSRIPPLTPVTDAFTGIFWPLALPVMVVAAFVSATARAITDQDGQFAGIDKDKRWAKENRERKSMKPQHREG